MTTRTETPELFPGFETRRVAHGESDLFVRIGGSGPPLLLLHGYPQTHAIWHKVAPELAGRFTLVIPDLPGYGASRGPAPDAEHRNYSKRAIASTLVALMDALGHRTFHVAGHDRGGRVGYRMCLDHPDRVKRFAAVDIIPTFEMFERLAKGVAMSGFHWFFLAQPAPLPERLIGADPDFFLESLITRWAGRRQLLAPEAVAHYKAAFRDPAVIAATCADYRAGFAVDSELDRADRDAGRKIQCPVLCLWGRGYMSKRTETPADVWRRWAGDVTDAPLDCGHFVVEEAPEGSVAALTAFFAAG